MFYQAEFGADARYAFPPPLAIGGVTWIPSFKPVVSLFVLSTVVLVVVSLVTRPPSEDTLQKFFGLPKEKKQ